MPRSLLPAYRLYHHPIKIVGVEVLSEDASGAFHFHLLLCPQYTRLSESEAARERDDRGNRRFSTNEEDLCE
jgi:hypothetical protein